MSWWDSLPSLSTIHTIGTPMVNMMLLDNSETKLSVEQKKETEQMLQQIKIKAPKTIVEVEKENTELKAQIKEIFSIHIKIIEQYKKMFVEQYLFISELNAKFSSNNNTNSEDH